MPDQPSSVDEPGDARPPWYVSADELSRLDLESPIVDEKCADPAAFEQLYSTASKEASDRQAAVYGLLSVICSFHFRPVDKVEPFSNQWAMGGRRSLQGSDFGQAQIDALHSALSRFENPALRTRIADVIWTRDKRKSECARIAIDGYVQLAVSLLREVATDRFERDPALGLTTQNYLTRAAVIAHQTGWQRDENDALRDAMIEALDKAKSRSGMALVRFGRLAIEHGLEAANERLADLDALAAESAEKGEFHEAESLQKLSISLARRKGDNTLIKDTTIKLTGILERKADVSNSAMLKTHALQEAIDSLHGLKGVREERQRLHEKLTEAQLHLFEEMGQFEHSVDLTEEVQRILTHLEGADLLECMRVLAVAELPRPPAALKEEARKTMQEHPLTSLFTTAILDGKGRTVARVEGAVDDAPDDDEHDALIHQVIKQEEIRVGIAVAGRVDPIRGVISQRFVVNFDVLQKICAISPFVPSGSEVAFARGIQSFLAGDDLAAAMMLVPYLEAGLRAMVGVAGRSDTKIATGGLEEVIGLSAMLGQHRDVLTNVFGEALVFSIEIVFVHEFGPKVRHSLCHGLTRDGAFSSEWYVYACKLIYSLVLLPLLAPQHWPSIRAAVVAETSLSESA